MRYLRPVNNPPAGAIETHPRHRTSGAGLIIVVGSLTLLPAVTTDMYLPSLPEVASDLGSSTAGAQFTITGMLLGGAIGQLFVGPFSDRVGRRRPALIGVALHVVISLLCTVVTGIVQLSTLRVVQGMVSAGATVVAIAVVRDLYRGSEAARLFSRLMLIIGAAPLLAPTVGAFVAEHWGWRAVFLTLAALAAGIGLLAYLFLPETLPPQRREVRRGVLRGYRILLSDRAFMGFAIVPGLGLGVIICYVAAAPFVFQIGFGLSKAQFALMFALIGASLVVGSQVNAAVVRRVGPLRLLRGSVPITAALASLLLVSGGTGFGGMYSLIALLVLIMGLLGFMMANASALALTRHGERAGTAAAVIGFLQAGGAGIVSSLVGPIGEVVGTTVAMAGMMLLALLLAIVSLAVATPTFRREGWREIAGALPEPVPPIPFPEP
jgi:MFS transporter, DHA1 family, multidrug resistance protein